MELRILKGIETDVERLKVKTLERLEGTVDSGGRLVTAHDSTYVHRCQDMFIVIHSFELAEEFESIRDLFGTAMG